MPRMLLKSTTWHSVSAGLRQIGGAISHKPHRVGPGPASNADPPASNYHGASGYLCKIWLTRTIREDGLSDYYAVLMLTLYSTDVSHKYDRTCTTPRTSAYAPPTSLVGKMGRSRKRYVSVRPSVCLSVSPTSEPAVPRHVLAIALALTVATIALKVTLEVALNVAHEVHARTFAVSVSSRSPCASRKNWTANAGMHRQTDRQMALALYTFRLVGATPPLLPQEVTAGPGQNWLAGPNDSISNSFFFKDTLGHR